jgi:hypothetical protein
MPASAVPEIDLRARITATLSRSNKPVSFKNLTKLTKAADEALRADLQQLVNAGHAYRWPDYRRSQYFWHVSPDEKAREAVLAAAVQALSKSELCRAAKRGLPGFSSAALEAIVSTMVAARRLQRVPAFTGSSRLLIRPGDREAYFKAARAFVEKKLRLAGFDPVAESQPKPDAARAILDAVKALEPVLGVPVSTLRLRNHLPTLTKPEFDAAALELRARQEVFLSLHADPYNLTQEDKDLLIDGHDGTYYVAIAIR